MSDSGDSRENLDTTGWIYEPNEIQITFRRFVRELVDEGVLLKKDWFRRSRKDGRFSQGVGLSDWTRWTNDARFVAWFYADFPEAQPMSKEEFALLDSLWTDGVVNGMQENEDWAYKLYANVRFKGDSKQHGAEEARELRSYLNDTAGSKWRTPTAEA